MIIYKGLSGNGSTGTCDIFLDIAEMFLKATEGHQEK